MTPDSACARVVLPTITASDRCINERRKTINGDDILWAMQSLGFDSYVEPLKRFLHLYREVSAARATAGGAGGVHSARHSRSDRCDGRHERHEPHSPGDSRPRANGPREVEPTTAPAPTQAWDSVRPPAALSSALERPRTATGTGLPEPPRPF